jgi:hypothetical protein
MKPVALNNNHYIYTSLSRHRGFENNFRNFCAAERKRTVSTLINEKEKVCMDYRFSDSDNQ